MPTESAITRLLYAILSQKCLKDIDWNKVARDPLLCQEITNGHAARMRYSRFKKQMDAASGTSSPSTPRKPRKNRVEKSQPQTRSPKKERERERKREMGMGPAKEEKGVKRERNGSEREGTADSELDTTYTVVLGENPDLKLELSTVMGMGTGAHGDMDREMDIDMAPIKCERKLSHHTQSHALGLQPPPPYSGAGYYDDVSGLLPLGGCAVDFGLGFGMAEPGGGGMSFAGDPYDGNGVGEFCGWGSSPIGAQGHDHEHDQVVKKEERWEGYRLL
ncbi:hypothetical protein QTJ16_006164 [Diplocarpon rosae]|uniref:Myb-like DNA-binding domain-containing protein n=1 Tax=Diplocarpon rosae TaxID=946125 RepID=A0AAD9WCV8_9HELO|nr:hypothetical protein QTJ16_006164 [Diplocarpon rosae]